MLGINPWIVQPIAWSLKQLVHERLQTTHCAKLANRAQYANMVWTRDVVTDKSLFIISVVNSWDSCVKYSCQLSPCENVTLSYKMQIAQSCRHLSRCVVYSRHTVQMVNVSACVQRLLCQVFLPIEPLWERYTELQNADSSIVSSSLALCCVFSSYCSDGECFCLCTVEHPVTTLHMCFLNTKVNAVMNLKPRECSSEGFKKFRWF